MTTPFPVPIHSRLDEMSSAVMRTNEKPSLPVPATPDTSGDGEKVRLGGSDSAGQVRLREKVRLGGSEGQTPHVRLGRRSVAGVW